MRTSDLAKLVSGLRRDRSLALDSLASAARIPLEDLEAFEGRHQPLSTSELRRLASALEIEFSAFLHGQVIPEPQPALFFRHLGPSDLNEDDRVSLARMLKEAETLAALENLRDIPSPVRGAFKGGRPGAEPWQGGYDAARELRALVGNRTEPIEDMIAFLEEVVRVPVHLVPLRTASAAAVTIKNTTSGAAVVALNANRIPRANALPLRVTIAHELAHVLLDVSEQPIGLTIDRDAYSFPDSSPNEQRAKAFAAELLIPLAGLKAYFGQPRGLFELEAASELIDKVRGRYLTPPELTVNHLYNLKYLDNDPKFREHLVEEAMCRPVPLPEPRLPAPDPQRLPRQVRRAYEDSLITANRARELLGLSVWDPLPWNTAAE